MLVKAGVVVGEGWHKRAGEPHAEVHALHAAGEEARGATAYVTLEPCSHHGRTPPLRRGAHQGRVTRVVAAMVDPNPQVAGAACGCSPRRGSRPISACWPQPGPQSRFFKRMRTAFPLVTVKAGGEPGWSPPWRVARASGSPLRRRAGTCSGCGPVTMRSLSSAETVLADGASLTVRWDELPLGQGGLSQRDPAPATAGHRDSQTGSPRICPCSRARARYCWPATRHPVSGPPGCSSWRCRCWMASWDLVSLFMLLAKQNVNSVLVEAGPRLCGACWRRGWWTSLCYQAPKLMGMRGAACSICRG